MVRRRIASRFVLIQGMAIQPRNAPKHQTGKLPPKARKKFSVLMDSIRQIQMALTRPLGVFISDARTLPTKEVMPITALTTPMASSPAFGFDSIMAGKAALYMDATRLMAARNRIRWKIPRFFCSQRIPSPALRRRLSF